MKLYLALVTLLLSTLTSLAAKGDQEKGIELAAIIFARIDHPESLKDVSEELEDYSPRITGPIQKAFEKRWQQRVESYFKNFDIAAKAYSKQLANGDSKNALRNHRKDFMQVYQLGEGPMKAKLKEISWPAIESIKELLIPKVEDIIASSPELQKQRLAIIELGKFRLDLIEAAVANNFDQASIESRENERVRGISRLDRKGLKILEENRKIAEKEEVPPAEARGCEEANVWRMLVGLNALVIDPKLCEAARGHSKDMEEHNFFAHDSPLPGKTTPWDRAALAGTTASGENIFMGNATPEAANKGWFYSPGHHKNMFGSGHRRIGLGQHNRHWTQLFGN